MEFTSTEKGQRKLIRDGYMYNFQKNLANDVTSWECVLRRKGECKSKVKLSPTGEFIEQFNEHTHPPSQTACEVAKVKANIKRKAVTTQEPTQDILADTLQNVSEGAAVNLPSMATLRRNVRYYRQERNLPANPINREAIPELPDEFRVTANGEQFLTYDSGVGDEERVFIFCSPQGLQLLGESEHWYGDGTFKICPEIYYQLYTVHAQLDGRIFPCAFALLPNKQETTYNQFFTQLFQLVRTVNGFALTDILVDFERAAINALSNLQPQLEIKGCFYHLCANIWKHIQSLGLQMRYNEEPEFALHLRMLSALAFVPPQNVEDGFDALTDFIRNIYNNEIDDLLEYFEDTYIGRYRRNAPRREPLFNINLWNMYHRTDDELPRTNNSVEGWHRGFQGHLSSCHPTFWRFLNVLKKEESLVRVSILQHLGGHHPPPPRRRYLDCNLRILRIVDDFPNRQLIDYLRSIAHNLGF